MLPRLEKGIGIPRIADIVGTISICLTDLLPCTNSEEINSEFV